MKAAMVGYASRVLQLRDTLEPMPRQAIAIVAKPQKHLHLHVGMCACRQEDLCG